MQFNPFMPHENDDLLATAVLPRQYAAAFKKNSR